MNKIISSVVLAIAACVSMADTSLWTTFNQKSVGEKNQNFRTGLAFDGYKYSFFEVNPVAGFTADSRRNVVLGGMFSVNLVQNKHFTFGPVATWTSSIPDLNHFNNSTWGFGVKAGYKF